VFQTERGKTKLPCRIDTEQVAKAGKGAADNVVWALVEAVLARAWEEGLNVVAIDTLSKRHAADYNKKPPSNDIIIMVANLMPDQWHYIALIINTIDKSFICSEGPASFPEEQWKCMTTENQEDFKDVTPKNIPAQVPGTDNCWARCIAFLEGILFTGEFDAHWFVMRVGEIEQKQKLESDSVLDQHCVSPKDSANPQGALFLMNSAQQGASSSSALSSSSLDSTDLQGPASATNSVQQDAASFIVSSRQGVASSLDSASSSDSTDSQELCGFAESLEDTCNTKSKKGKDALLSMNSAQQGASSSSPLASSSLDSTDLQGASYTSSSSSPIDSAGSQGASSSSSDLQGASSNSSSSSPIDSADLQGASYTSSSSSPIDSAGSQGVSSASSDLWGSTPVIQPLPTPPCSPLPSDLRPNNIECRLCKRLFTNKQGLTSHRKTCVILEQPQQPDTKVSPRITDLGTEDPGDPNLETLMNAGSYEKEKKTIHTEMTDSDTEDADDPTKGISDADDPTKDIFDSDTKDADKPSLAKGVGKKSKTPRALQDTDTPNTKARNNLLPVARNLDTGTGDEGVAGEPSQLFVDRLAEIIPRNAFLLDLGHSTGCFLVEMSKKRPDIRLSGVEADGVRFKMSQALHKGLLTNLAHQNIMNMDSLHADVTCVFAHDTAWTESVVEKSTLLVLLSPNVQIVVCVKARPELVDCGRFVVSERIRFNLRGGKTERVASVYRATSVLTIEGLRTLVGEHARHFFSRDRDFYYGLTEIEKRNDMEVRPSDCHLLAKL
jgi:hypothetical protein